MKAKAKNKETPKSIERVNLKIDEIIPYARNPRINADAVAKVKASIKEFGFKQDIVVDPEYVIIAGHTRYQAAKELNLTELPVIIAHDLTPAQVKAYRIADNKVAEFSKWNNELLPIELQELLDQNYNIDVLGFSQDEIDTLLKEELTALDESKLDDIPELTGAPVTKLGDIWQLGDHRLMCGDSTSIDAVEKLMDGEKAKSCFTSPPYNGDTHLDYGKGKNKKLYNNDFDSKTSDEYVSFCHEVLANIFIVTQGFVFWNVSYNAKSRYEYIKGIYPYVDKLWETIVWKKTGMPISSGLTRNFEFVFCFKTFEDKKHLGKEFETDFNVWEISNIGSQNKDHRACFPVELAVKGVELSTKQKDLVLDPFGGTGTTLIACEKTGRECRMMELDPCYCDVIIKRWESITGKKAELVRQLSDQF